MTGATLNKIQESEFLQYRLLDLCDKAESVIATRVSPKQKANIVLMMKERYRKRTALAIGDGSNDVSMINAADIGIGISGLEG